MGWVYFIRSGTRGPFKIGTTIHTPHSRARGLQTGNPEELHVIAAVQGGPELEARLHGRFASSHLRGEWFNPTQELVAFIEGIRLSHAQPEDDGATCPFTDEQLQWLQGWHAALHECAIGNAEGAFAAQFEGPLDGSADGPLERVVDTIRALDAMRNAIPTDGCDCEDGSCLACEAREVCGSSDEDALPRVWDLESRASEALYNRARRKPPVDALEWLHGALSVAFHLDELHAVRKDHASGKDERVERGRAALRRMDETGSVALDFATCVDPSFNDVSMKSGWEFGLQFFRVDEYRSGFAAWANPKESRGADGDDEPVDLSAALSTIMLGIGGDGS